MELFCFLEKQITVHRSWDELEVSWFHLMHENTNLQSGHEMYKEMPKLLERSSSISIFLWVLSALFSLQIRNIVYLCKKHQHQSNHFKIQFCVDVGQKRNPWGMCVHNIWHVNISVGLQFQYFVRKKQSLHSNN